MLDLTEFKTKQDYDTFVKGNEVHLSNKTVEGKFELFVCNKCLSHFDDINERDEHLANHRHADTKLGIKEIVDN